MLGSEVPVPSLSFLKAVPLLFFLLVLMAEKFRREKELSALFGSCIQSIEREGVFGLGVFCWGCCVLCVFVFFVLGGVFFTFPFLAEETSPS